MERKIGEIFEYNDEWYQCLENNSYCCGCDYCDFGELGDCDIIACSSSERNDNKEVYFKKLEKVGEPYEYFVQHKGIVMLQPYKLFTIPFINGVICNVHNDTNTIDLEIKQNKEDMEEKKLNLKPFDIQKAREGKPVCTRDGRKARIICFDSNGGRPIVALVTECDDEEEIPYKYHCDGSYNCQSIPSDKDLMMLTEKRIGWITINKDAGLFKSKEEAERYCTKDYATVRVEFEI